LQSLIHSRVKRSHPEFLTNKAIRLLEEATLALERAKRDRDQVLDDVEDEFQPSPQISDKNIPNTSAIIEKNSFAEILKLETGNPVPQWPSKYLSYAPDSIRVFQEPAFLQSDESKTSDVQENNEDPPTQQKLKSLQADLDPGKLLPKYPKYSENIFKPDYNSDTCSPEKHIFFLKTHKTASSTIQNIFYRYGDTNNLTFAMPKSGNRFMYPFYIRKTMLRPEPHYNIICNHMRYQRGILDPLFYERKSDENVVKNPVESPVESLNSIENQIPSTPKINPIKITILREPASLFESTFGYLKNECPAFVRAGKSLETFLSNPEFYYRQGEGGQFWMFGHNHVMFDLGFSADLEDENRITTAIEIVDQTFDLVMIMEHFEESIILLKHILCLKSYTDVVYVVANARSDKKSVSDDFKQKVYDWNKADSLLYKKFNQTLWDKIEVFGFEKMNQEIVKLNTAIDAVVSECFIGQTSDDDYAKKIGQFRPNSEVGIMSHILRPDKVDNELCQNLARPELKYAAKILKKQYPGWTSFY